MSTAIPGLMTLVSGSIGCGASSPCTVNQDRVGLAQAQTRPCRQPGIGKVDARTRASSPMRQGGPSCSRRRSPWSPGRSGPARRIRRQGLRRMRARHGRCRVASRRTFSAGPSLSARPSWTFRSRPAIVRQSDSKKIAGWTRATGSQASQANERTSVVRNARIVAEPRSPVTQPISPTSSPGPIRPARTSLAVIRTHVDAEQAVHRDVHRVRGLALRAQRCAAGYRQPRPRLRQASGYMHRRRMETPLHCGSGPRSDLECCRRSDIGNQRAPDC